MSDQTRGLIDELVARSGGVTVELCASAASAAESLRDGLDLDTQRELTASTRSSLHAAWKLLSRDAQLLLRLRCHVTAHSVPFGWISMALLSLGLDDARIKAALRDVRRRQMSQYVSDGLKVHHIVAAFVSEVPASARELVEGG